MVGHRLNYTQTCWDNIKGEYIFRASFPPGWYTIVPKLMTAFFHVSPFVRSKNPQNCRPTTAHVIFHYYTGLQTKRGSSLDCMRMARLSRVAFAHLGIDLKLNSNNSIAWKNCKALCSDCAQASVGWLRLRCWLQIELKF